LAKFPLFSVVVVVGVLYAVLLGCIFTGFACLILVEATLSCLFVLLVWYCVALIWYAGNPGSVCANFVRCALIFLLFS
jgi:hypothetical protein